jgi:hypothetical protein
MNSLIFSSFFFLHLLSGGACYPSELPHRNLAGVTVIDTPIVRDAIAYAQGYEDNSVFNHSMRSWIFGSIVVNKNSVYTKAIDKEVHALGSILHDVGFGENVKPELNADVTGDHAALGGNAVRKFLANNIEGKLWTDSRVRLLVDAVTLHLEDSDSTKAIEIRAVRDGQQVDLAGGPLGYVTAAEYASVVAAYPLGDMKEHLAQQHGQPNNPSGHSQSSNSGHEMMSPSSGHQMSPSSGHQMSPNSGHQMMSPNSGHQMTSPDSKAHGPTL